MADLGLDTKGAEITVSGGTLSPEEREKVILAVGNVEAPEAEDAVFHTVEKGDTLSAISKKNTGQRQPLRRDFQGEQADVDPSRPNLSRSGSVDTGRQVRQILRA